MPEQSITTIDFHGTEIIVLPGDTPATTMIPMKPFVERMGLSWTAQLRRIKSNQILFEGMRILSIPSAGGRQDFVALPLSLINGWMIGIQPGHIADQQKRSLVLHYQREAFDVLFRHFFGKALGENRTLSDEAILNRFEAIERTLEVIANAIAELARSRRPAAVTSSARRASRHFKPMRRILLGQDVLPTVKHDTIYKRCSEACAAWCDASEDRRDAYEPNDSSVARRFDEETALRWYRERGKRFIAAHRRVVKAQMVMKFPKPIQVDPGT